MVTSQAWPRLAARAAQVCSRENRSLKADAHPGAVPPSALEWSLLSSFAYAGVRHHECRVMRIIPLMSTLHQERAARTLSGEADLLDKAELGRALRGGRHGHHRELDGHADSLVALFSDDFV